MDEKALLDALSKHLGLLASLQWWMMATAIAAIYMQVMSKNELDLKLIKVTREDAAKLLGWFYVIGLAGFFITLVRLYLLIEIVPKAQLNATLTIMGTAAWLFNPFAYFGDSARSLIVSGASLLALILVWCFGYVALVSLSGKLKRLDPVLITGFVVFGALSLGLVRLIDLLLQSRIAADNPQLSTTLASWNASRASQMKWFIAIGLVATLIAVGVIDRQIKSSFSDSLGGKREAAVTGRE